MPRGITRSLTLRERIKYKKWYPCPGFLQDPANRKHKFDTWHKRGSAAWRLYWRTHPELYALMTDGKSPQ